MNESILEIMKIIGMIVLLIFTSFLIHKEISSNLDSLGFKLNKENKKKVNWLISSIIGILTVYFYLLRLLLSL